MSIRVALLAAAASILLANSAAAAQRVIANVGLEGSECIRYDAANDRYVISNLATRGPENNGYISLMSPDGAIQNLKFIEGGKNGVTLIDPLGIAIHDGVIYVADSTHMRKFDLQTGAPRGEVALTGAGRPNDIFVTADGTAYVSDTGSPGAIIKVTADGTVSLFTPRDDSMERPNGVAVMPDGNIVHGGRGVNLVFRDPTGKIVREQTLPTGQFDGIVPLANGDLLVSSQLGKNVYRVSAAAGPVVEVAKDITVPAAIGYDTKRNRLLIPQIALASITMVDLP